MSQVDLHLHTTCSDGRLTPAQLIELVAERGLRVVAITDHDSTEGLTELSTDIPGNEIHVLGYFIRYHDASFQQTLREFRDGRVDRAREMVGKLAALGLPVDWDRVLELAGGAVGRPHIAQAMVEKGYITYPQEAFIKYLGRNGLAYAEREKLTPSEAVKLIASVGGLPVLAHPREVDNVEPMLPELKSAGLVGMEVYYGTYKPSEVKIFAAMAKKYGLIPCGGSDYHALGTPEEVEPGTVGPSMEIAEELYAMAGSKITLSQ
jgi:predicted metal-dependent phosphoesterase TrpH